ncbi:hypothetical protein BBJ28_00019580 [Nothophytophthora sp. Chile5]|nr:hypothetical protein BBJ28_00019580 [Nothophytophthora sp. Chile5]
MRQEGTTQHDTLLPRTRARNGSADGFLHRLASLSALCQQMRQMQDALKAMQMDASSQQSLKEENKELERDLRELARALDEEREERLKCPITLDLYEDPAPREDILWYGAGARPQS